MATPTFWQLPSFGSSQALAAPKFWQLPSIGSSKALAPPTFWHLPSFGTSQSCWHLPHFGHSQKPYVASPKFLATPTKGMFGVRVTRASQAVPPSLPWSSMPVRISGPLVSSSTAQSMPTRSGTSCHLEKAKLWKPGYHVGQGAGSKPKPGCFQAMGQLHSTWVNGPASASAYFFQYP